MFFCRPFVPMEVLNTHVRSLITDLLRLFALLICLACLCKKGYELHTFINTLSDRPSNTPSKSLSNT